VMVTFIFDDCSRQRSNDRHKYVGLTLEEAHVRERTRMSSCTVESATMAMVLSLRLDKRLF
jgi:hypothetical protein